ncbi:MAG: hypothetical protein WC466_03895 [Candidatus Izemoplasmatales bacterium]
MKNFVFIAFVFIFAFSSCKNKTNQVSNINDNSVQEPETTISESNYSNPAIIYGSDFMSFMQSLRKIGDYENLLKFTATKSIEKHGENSVKKYYEENFTNMSQLELKSIVDNEDGTKTMNYVNLSMATKTVAPVLVVIENDSCKLILPNNLSEKLIN